MSLTTTKEKMAMVRLASVIERLHAQAGDPSIPQQEGVEAARALGETMLKNIELITAGLRKAGK